MASALRRMAVPLIGATLVAIVIIVALVVFGLGSAGSDESVIPVIHIGQEVAGQTQGTATSQAPGTTGGQNQSPGTEANHNSPAGQGSGETAGQASGSATSQAATSTHAQSTAITGTSTGTSTDTGTDTGTTTNTGTSTGGGSGQGSGTGQGGGGDQGSGTGSSLHGGRTTVVTQEVRVEPGTQNQSGASNGQGR